MARPRHQSGWITESGRTIYGNFWRYFVDSTSGEQKRKQGSLPLGQVGKMKKWEAKEKLKSLIAEDLGPKQSVERPDPKTTFAWFVRYRYLPIPHRVRPYIEAWRKVCPNTSPDALMFPTQGHRKNKGLAVPFRAKNFFKWKVWPVSDRLGIPRNLCTFQVFRRTLGTDLQKHGTMKDAQAILRHKHIKTTAEVYMDHIPDSVRKAIDARTEAIFELRRKKRSRKSPGV